MILVFELILSLLCSCYIILLIWLCKGIWYAQELTSGFHRDTGKSTSFNSKTDLPTVSIIVCARNEEQNLPTLLAHLTSQNYPKDKLEICLVDDRSTDSTSSIMAIYSRSRNYVKHIKITDLLPDFAPKKRAIDLAIGCSIGEIIILTDADAQPGPNWIFKIAKLFKFDIAMVCGYSPYYPRKNRLQNILALEYFSQAAVAAATIGLNSPMTCTGSNLAYRRSAFLRIGGFEGISHYISGDDDLLLHKIHKQGLRNIIYTADSDSQAAVAPPASWSEFRAQRTRYASKGLYYHLNMTLTLVVVYLLNVMLILGFLSILAGQVKLFFYTVGCGFIKAGAEYFFLKKAANWFGEGELLKSFSLTAFLHPFYIVYFATRAQFAKFSWHGDSFSAKIVK